MTKFSRQPISFLKCSFFELFVAKERDDLDSDRRGPLIAPGPRPRQCPLEVLEPRVAGGSEMLRFTLCPQACFADGGPAGMQGIRLWPRGPRILQTPRGEEPRLAATEAVCSGHCSRSPPGV